MHYVFVDERYQEDREYRTIVVATWAVPQDTLNDNLEQLALPGKARLLPRIESAFENLNAVAFVGRATLPKSVFRSGEIDGCDDIPAMARADTIWSMATLFAVGRVLFEAGRIGQLIKIVDVFLDPKSLASLPFII